MAAPKADAGDTTKTNEVEVAKPEAEATSVPAKAKEPDVVKWTDAAGNKCTGSRHGSAYREYLRSKK